MPFEPFHFEAPTRPHAEPNVGEQSGDETGVLTVPKIDEPGTSGSNYRVLLYNDDWHGYDEVIEQVMKATSCSFEKAVRITAEAHSQGRAICFRGARNKCHEVTRVLREIRLQCEVDCD